MGKFKFDAFGMTDAGVLDKTNEDSYIYKIVDAGLYFAGIFAVADGVGGLENGEVASSSAISNINKWWESEFKTYYNDREYLITSLKARIEEINKELMRLSEEYAGKMATTLTILLIYKDEGYIFHIGDSRVYRLAPGIRKQFEQLTKDHSVAINVPYEGGFIRKSMLTECLGHKKEINIYCSVREVRKGEVYIVCSDGAYKTTDMGELGETVRCCRTELGLMCKEIVSKAKTKGETDNISVVAVGVY